MWPQYPVLAERVFSDIMDEVDPRAGLFPREHWARLQKSVRSTERETTRLLTRVRIRGAAGSE